MFTIVFVSEVIKYITSTKGKQLILYYGYVYYHKRKVESKAIDYWFCTSVTSKKCKGKLVLGSEQNVISVNHDHNHEPPKFYISDGVYFRL